jgi:2'-5' RNA ligase
MVRAFVALGLSSEIKDSLRKAQESLRRCRARLTMVDPEIIHITVKFLGEVDEKKISLVKEALLTIRFVPFVVTAGPVTVNNPHSPRTVWSVIEDNGQCSRLSLLVDNTLAPLGFARESRRFTPHATVARVKSFDPSLFPTLDQLKDSIYGSCTISGIKLKKSTLTPAGPVYNDLLEVVW